MTQSSKIIAERNERLAISSSGSATFNDNRTTNIYLGEGSLPSLNAEMDALRFNLLPAILTNFVGREEEIYSFRQFILTDGAKPNILSIHGMGGVGKTELAIKVGHELVTQYPDAQMLLDFQGTSDNPRNPMDAIRECIAVFTKGREPIPNETGDVLQMYRQCLGGKRGILILDNVADEAQVTMMRPTEGWILIVTSRNQLPFPGILLDQFPDVASIELFRLTAPRVPVEIAREICQLCGHLPLAVRAASSLLFVTRDMSPKEYLDKLRAEHLRLEAIGQHGVQRGIEATFNLSYSLLNPEEQRVFRQLSVFPSTFSRHAATLISECNDYSLSDLVRRSLVSYDEMRSYRLHDLVRIFAKKKLQEFPKERGDALARLGKFYISNQGTTSDKHTRCEVGRELLDVGYLHVSTNDTTNAIQVFQLAIHFLRDAGNPRMYNTAIEALTLTYESNDMPHLAKLLREQKQQEIDEEYSAVIRAHPYLTLSLATRYLSNPFHLIRYNEEVFEWLSKHNTSTGSDKVRIHLNLSYAYERIGHAYKAMQHVEAALKLSLLNNLVWHAEVLERAEYLTTLILSESGQGGLDTQL